MVGQEILVIVACVLHAAVRMMQESCFRFASPQRHGERVGGKLRSEPAAHGPADDRPRVEIEHDGEIKPAFVGPEWSERLGVVGLSPGLSSPNRTCTSQRIRLSI